MSEISEEGRIAFETMKAQLRPHYDNISFEMAATDTPNRTAIIEWGFTVFMAGFVAAHEINNIEIPDAIPLPTTEETAAQV